MVAATNFALLHGGGQGSWLWDDVIGELSASGEVDCIALDVPGCGAKRGRDTSAIEFDNIARELIGHQVMNTRPQALAAALIAETQT